MRASQLLWAVAAGVVSMSAVVGEATATSGPAESSAASAEVASTPGPKGPVAEPAGQVGEKPSAKTAEVAPKVVPVPAPRKAPAPTLRVKIDLSSQRLELHYDGRRQESWPISSGREGYPTPRGVYRPQWASKMWYSRKYDNAPMPHAVFFTGGVAVHGTQSVGALGQPASHGCVRLAPANAARFYALVHKHGYARTRIEVFGTPPAPRIAKRSAPAVALGAAQTRRSRIAGGPPAAQRPPSYGWVGPTQSQPLRRHSDGLVYLPPNSPYRGQSTFVHNGVVYMRVR